MSIFAPTHKLIAPAGEETPVMLFSQSDSHKYRVMSEIEYLEGSEAIYEWAPLSGGDVPRIYTQWFKNSAFRSQSRLALFPGELCGELEGMGLLVEK